MCRTVLRLQACRDAWMNEERWAPSDNNGERNKIHPRDLQEFPCPHSKLTCSTFHDSWLINLAICLRDIQAFVAFLC